MSDTFFRLITTARLTLHLKQGCASPYLRSCRTGSKAWRSLICASRAWRRTALVARFDGSCHRADAAGVLGSLCGSLRGTTTRFLPPGRPAPFLAARAPPRRGYTRSRPLRAFTPITPMYRNASSLGITPPSKVIGGTATPGPNHSPAPGSAHCSYGASPDLWRVPREANKEADFLAGIAGAVVRNEATLPISLPAPAGEEWQSTATIALSERSSFCLVECPTFHAQDLAHIRAHHPNLFCSSIWVACSTELLSKTVGNSLTRCKALRVAGDAERSACK